MLILYYIYILYYTTYYTVHNILHYYSVYDHTVLTILYNTVYRYIDGNVPTMEGKDIHADANSSSDQEEEQEGEVVHDQIDTTSSSGNTSGSGGGAGRTKLQQRFVKLSAALCEVVDDFGLVSFHPLNIEDAEVSSGQCI